MTTRIVLVRHGHSQATADGVVGGPKGCKGLTELGRRQVQALADRVMQTGELDDASVLLASTLPRAIETAEILAPAIGGLEIETDCDLCELHPGECDGLTWDAWREQFGGGDEAVEGSDDWQARWDRPFSPGGESVNQFTQRAGQRVRRLLDDYAGRTIVVATHGGVILSSMYELLGVHPTDQQRAYLDPSNTALTEWTHDGARWNLIRYNDYAHLTALAD